MTQTVEAVFDGAVLRPETALELEPNTRVRLTVEVMPCAEAARHRRTPAQEVQAILAEPLAGREATGHCWWFFTCLVRQGGGGRHTR